MVLLSLWCVVTVIAPEGRREMETRDVSVELNCTPKIAWLFGNMLSGNCKPVARSARYSAEPEVQVVAEGLLVVKDKTPYAMEGSVLAFSPAGRSTYHPCCLDQSMALPETERLFPLTAMVRAAKLERGLAMVVLPSVRA